MLIEVACHECGYFKKQGAGIYAKLYTRLPFPSCELTAEGLKMLEGCGIPRSALSAQDQSNCAAC
jgi:hypothetical protein